MPDKKVHEKKRHQNEVAKTSRPDSPELEEGTPLPEELTGRASKTSEDITVLFDEETAEHLADGFNGGSGDDEGSDLAPEPDTGSSDLMGHRRATLDE